MKVRSSHVTLPLLAVTIMAVSGCASRGIEEPAFDLVEQTDELEIRDYAPRLVAQTRVEGDQKEAGNAGFRILADYIFGNNTRREEISMTAPVSQAADSEKIAMTAPVSQLQADGEWLVRFALPSTYTMENVPAPVDERVSLQVLPAARFAVLEFSGYARAARVQDKRMELVRIIDRRSLDALGPITLAQYDPPWTLWFLRRNEVMVPIAR